MYKKENELLYYSILKELKKKKKELQQWFPEFKAPTERLLPLHT
jgi:hypothetical protein